MKRRDYLYSGFVLLLATSAYAGATGSIDGTVVDQADGHVVGGGVRLDVACGTVHKSASIDGAGHFSLAGLPEGACTLVASGAAYVSTSYAVTVAGGSISTVLVDITTKAYAAKQAEQARHIYMRAPMVNGRGMPMPAPMPAMAPPMEADFAAGAPPPPPMHAAPKPARVGATVARAATPQVAVAANVVRIGGGGGTGGGKAGKDEAQLARGHRMAVAGKLKNVEQQRRPPADANGWAVVRVFPVPQYTKAYDGPRTDFRETVYWNPAVETDGNGNADVTFATNDSVTAFRATAEGFSAAGTPGIGSATFNSKLPLTLDTHLPIEVTSGDTIQLPVTMTNETADAIDANLAMQFGSAFKLVGAAASSTIHLAPHAKQSVFVGLDVVATDGDADVSLALTGRGLSDEVKKTIRVVPRGFPIEASASGTAKQGQRAAHELDLVGALPGSIRATVTMYPSPVAAMTEGMAGMIREPGGCFEQTSSTNYPNIMILGYLQSSDNADAALVAKTQTVLDHGYKLLTGYETPEKGYEWFGHTPGHEALTAYGLMEFADMSKVYDVDHKMVERTAEWLMSRRDQQGGFARSSEALDSFGRASTTTTNAYIMWALAEAKRTNGMTKELAVQQQLGSSTQDPYLLALATNTNLVAALEGADTAAMVKHLAGLQAKDGSFTGAKETITMSGGESLTIETTALAVLALIKASPNNEYETQIRAGVDWLNGKRGGYGAWGNTQATILGLKALTAYTEHARQMQVAGSATVVINGHAAGTIAFDKGRRDALVWDSAALAGKLHPGKNTIEVRLAGGASLPYTIAVDYRSPQPAAAPRAKVSVTTQLLATHAKMGEGVTLRAHVENTTAAGIPMTLARVGLPGGMVFQTWQLKELRDKGVIDFYETRPREVILYWRALPPSAKKDVDLDLLAAVPGTYEAPASSAYLYYTAEDKAWTKSVAITIDK